MGTQPIKVALLGAGVVGTEVARLIIEQSEDLAARIGAPLEVVGVGVRRAGARDIVVDESLLTTDLAGLIDSSPTRHRGRGDGRHRASEKLDPAGLRCRGKCRHRE